MRKPEEIVIHRFEDTGEAYDESQCRDDIEMGDILVVESEKVVAFLLSAWPVAVTVEHGKLHAFEKRNPYVGPCERDNRDWTPYFERAKKVARELNLPLSVD